MKKKWKNLNRIFIIFCLFIFIVNNKSYGDRHGDGAVPVPNPGEIVTIPTDFEQVMGTRETIDRKWQGGTRQAEIYDLWHSQGENYDPDTHWAYVTVANQKRYLVALSQYFGMAGAYVDIYLENGTVLPCIMGDEKRLHEPDKADNTSEGAFWHNGMSYGHCYIQNGQPACNVVEAMFAPADTPYDDMYNFLQTLYPVRQIVYGGTYIDNPEGPTGLNGPYTISSTGSSSGGKDHPIAKAVGQFFRKGWIALATLCDNINTGSEAESVMIALFS